MNTIKAFFLYLLMLVAAATNNKKMQAWLDGVLDRLPE